MAILKQLSTTSTIRTFIDDKGEIFFEGTIVYYYFKTKELKIMMRGSDKLYKVDDEQSQSFLDEILNIGEEE